MGSDAVVVVARACSSFNFDSSLFFYSIIVQDCDRSWILSIVARVIYTRSASFLGMLGRGSGQKKLNLAPGLFFFMSALLVLFVFVPFS